MAFEENTTQVFASRNGYNITVGATPVQGGNNVSTLTNNLSGVVESLLADYVEHERQQRLAKANTADATVAMWNAFNAKHGSFADEYSSL